MRPIVFLDIDGVLNRGGDLAGPARLVPELVARLRKLVLDFGAEVVLTTTWRVLGLDVIIPWFEARGFPEAAERIVGVTPSSDRQSGELWLSRPRCDEIRAYLATRFGLDAERPPFVVIDDHDSAMVMGHTVITASAVGLTERDAASAAEVLERQIAARADAFRRTGAAALVEARETTVPMRSGFGPPQLERMLGAMRRSVVVVVTGGRDFADARFMGDLLDWTADVFRVRVVIHGACGLDADQAGGEMTGADALADAWARERGFPFPMVESSEGPHGLVPMPAAWTKLGKAAGPTRNRAMVRFAEGLVSGNSLLRPLLVAAPGGAGTASCIEAARRAGWRVLT